MSRFDEQGHPRGADGRWVAKTPAQPATTHTCAWRTRRLVGSSGSPDRADLQGKVPRVLGNLTPPPTSMSRHPKVPRVLGDLGLDAVSVRALCGFPSRPGAGEPGRLVWGGFTHGHVDEKCRCR